MARGRNVRIWLAVIFAIALVVRLGILLVEPKPISLNGLSSADGEVARNILVHGRWDFVVSTKNGPIPKYGKLPGYDTKGAQLVDIEDLDWTRTDRAPSYQRVVNFTPGVGIVEAGVWGITGSYRFKQIQVLQMVMDSLMVLLVFWMGVRLFHRPRAALIAAFGYAIAIPVARYANIPHVDIWAIDLNIVGAALFVGAVDAERKWPWLVGVGLVAGAGLWFRPVIGWFLMAVALAFWVGWREALKLVVVPILVAAVVITPWFVRNYNDFHRVVYRTGTGQGTWEGLGQLRNDFGARWSDSAANQTVRRERPDIKYGTVQFDDYLRKKSIHAIKTHPGFYAKLLAWRAYRALWYAHSPWRWAYPGVPSSAYRGSSPADVAHYFSADPGNATIYYATFVLKVPATLLFLAVIPTLVLARRRYGRQLAMLLAVMLGTFLPYWLFDVEPEYALPASFAYVLVGALGIDLAIEGRVWERLRRPRRKLAAAESV